MAKNYTPVLVSEREQQKPRYLLKRNSPTTNLIDRVLIAGANDLDSLLSTTSHAIKTTYEIQEEKNGQYKFVAKYTSGSEESFLEIPDLSKLSGNNKTARAFLTYALIKINEQCISQDNVLYNNFIKFDVNDLVRSPSNPFGLYTKRPNAIRGFKTGADVLTSLKVKGEAKNKRNNSFCAGLEVLFTGARIENNTCYLFLNERINWPVLLPYITMIPPYTLKLLITNSKAGELVEYIFYLARQKQNAEQIRKTGKFKISYAAIADRLNLPLNTKNPKRNVKDVIEKAIEDIEKENAEAYGDDDFTITPSNYDAPDTLPFKQWLTGYVTIEFKHGLKEYFADRAASRKKQVTKKQTAKTKAIADNAQKARTKKDTGTAADQIVTPKDIEKELEQFDFE